MIPINTLGSVNEKELYSSLLAMSRDRKQLKTALVDAEYSMDRLDAALKGFVWILLIVSYFMIFGADPQTVLVTFSSFLLAIAFAIGNSVVRLLECIIFIFVRHPFDGKSMITT